MGRALAGSELRSLRPHSTAQHVTQKFVSPSRSKPPSELLCIIRRVCVGALPALRRAVALAAPYGLVPTRAGTRPHSGRSHRPAAGRWHPACARTQMAHGATPHPQVGQAATGGTRRRATSPTEGARNVNAEGGGRVSAHAHVRTRRASGRSRAAESAAPGCRRAGPARSCAARSAAWRAGARAGSTRVSRASCPPVHTTIHNDIGMGGARVCVRDGTLAVAPL